MPEQITDQAVLAHIQGLVEEEERLYAKGKPTEADQARLARLGVQLDQCWDLLRQRRALREFGKDPSDAHVRPPSVVEKYTG